MKSESFYIKCKACGHDFSSACWTCTTCQQELCEKCGIHIGLLPKNSKCLSNRNLIWRPDSSAYYESKGLKYGFNCKLCKMFKTNSSWHCRICEYDICKKCMRKSFDVRPFEIKLNCHKGHDLKKQTLAIKNLKDMNGKALIPKCNLCSKQFRGKGLACTPCNFYYCTECVEYLESPAAGHPILSCQSKHLMRWVTSEEFQCSICSGKFNQEHYKCKECNFNVCLNCSQVMINCVNANEIKNHGNEQHRLKWNFRFRDSINGAVQCYTCKINYKAGMFSCEQCQNKYCAFCYDNPNKPKPLRGNVTQANSLRISYQSKQ